jgi:hypothetical protein
LRREADLGAAESAPLHHVQAAAILLDLGEVGLDLGRRDIEVALGRALIALDIALYAALGAIAQHFDRLADIARGRRRASPSP